MDLTGKVAIVTGCSNGIGLATTQAFLLANAHVFGIDMSPFPTPSPLPTTGKGRFHFHQANLLSPSATDAAVAACVAEFGSHGVDILANVAGVMDNYESADTLTDDGWDRVMGVNAMVPAKLMRAVLGLGGMKARESGSIVNVSSKSGIGGASAGLAYTASKHAVIGMTKNVAWRFRDHGIRCNAICPGGVPTNILSSMNLDRLDMDAYKEMEPFHNLHMHRGPPHQLTGEDIANSIVFLASDVSRHISGTVLPVDMAWSAA